MFSKNPIMLKDGYAPAAATARRLRLALSTIHRMVEDDRIEGTRVGRGLYIKLESLESYFDEESNEAMKKEVSELRKDMKKELAEYEAEQKQKARSA